MNKFHISLSLLFQISLFRFYRFCFSVNFSNTWVCFIFVISVFIMPRGIKGSGKKPKVFPIEAKTCEGKSEIKSSQSSNFQSFQNFSLPFRFFPPVSPPNTLQNVSRQEQRLPGEVGSNSLLFLWFWAGRRWALP